MPKLPSSREIYWYMAGMGEGAEGVETKDIGSFAYLMLDYQGFI